jgi:2-oxoisovalerate dehydrogenase E2 component (dihydrolipoyl transacylase)
MTERTFALPDLGEGLEEATVGAWLVAEGARVELNQPIAEVETAKATVELPSPFAGRVVRIHAEAGATLGVGDPLVTIEVDAGREGALAARTPAPAAPAVRALARRRGVDLSSLTGTGPQGRITREDVEGAAEGRTAARRREPAGADHPAGADRGTREVPLTPLRRTAAERLTRASAVPTVTTWRTVDATALEAVRAEAGLSPLPFLVRALADVCARHPLLNASWTADAVLVHRRVHVGIAADTERGLLVPVVHGADALGVRELAGLISELAEAARDGTIGPDALAGHTITVTNTGSYGSEAGTPLLNLPDAAIVALGAIEPRALVVDGAVVARPALILSMTFDHRVLDGAAAGRALSDLVSVLEDERALRGLPA